MEGRTTRKNSTKGEEELHTLVKTIVTTLCTSEDFISKITKVIIENISKEFKEDIRKLKDENMRLNEKIENQDTIIEVLGRKQEKQDEIFRCRNILFYGIKENQGEVCSRTMLNLFADTMTLNIDEAGIESCYRIGRKTKNKNRAILVKFSSRYYKEIVYKNKKLLKQTKIVAREDLTPNKTKILKAALEKVGKNGKVWTSYGNVFVKYDNMDQIMKIFTMDDANALPGATE